MLVRLDTFAPWAGEPLPTLVDDEIQPIVHPRNIEQLWSTAELAAIGLAIPVPFPTPEGKVRVGSASYELVEGEVHEIYAVEDAPPPAVPFSISDRQFFQQLSVQEIITEQEAEDAVATGTIPAAMLALVELLPEQARFSARMILKGATVFERGHEMTDTIGWLYGWSEGQTDDLFRAAAVL